MLNKNALLKLFLLLLLAGSFGSACTKDKNNTENKTEKKSKNNSRLKIVLSKGSGSQSYENYSQWLSKFEDSIKNTIKDGIKDDITKEIEFVDLYKLSFEEARKQILSCDGLLLTGGPDVHPGRFDQSGDTSRCSIDQRRDTLEFELIKLALEQKIPTLGVCRGLQILNVALGGTLVVDIPDDIGDKVIHQVEDADAVHTVRLDKSTYFYEITKQDSGLVNSNHHQAIGELADALIISSRTDDNLAESIEWKNKEDKSWLLAVQWHPERLKKGHPLSDVIAMEFLSQAMLFNQKKLKKKD